MSVASLTILVAQARAFLDRQWDAFESQDRKIAGLFALATGLITLVPTIVSAFAAEELRWRLVPFGMAAVAYGVAAWLHWLAYRPSEVHHFGNARTYVEEWLASDEERVLELTLYDLARAQEANDDLLSAKSKAMRAGAAAVAVEAGLLLTGVLAVAV